MDAIIKWAIIGAMVVSIAALAYMGWQKSVAEPYREQGRAELRPSLEKAQRDHEAANQLLARQGKLLDDLAKAAKYRIAQADAARAAAQRRADAAETRVQAILEMQPTVPGSPCESACKLLSEPL